MPSMSRVLRYSALSAVIAGLAVSGVFAAGGSRSDTSSEAEKTPEQESMELYNQGLSARDRAWKMQNNLGDLPEAKRAKTEGKIKNAYEQAVDSFRGAIAKNPQNFQAMGSLGYSYRQLGNYDMALEAYDAALNLKPDYPEAMEYRAEAYLALNRVDDAKRAYDKLRSLKPEFAADLIGAMHSWLAARRDDANGMKVGELDDFERWLGTQQGGEAPMTSSLRKARHW